MKIFLLLPTLAVLSVRPITSFAATSFSVADSNIIISNKTDHYAFEEGDKDYPVIIRHEGKTTYYCNELRAAIPWSEVYSGQSRIDGVKISFPAQPHRGRLYAVCPHARLHRVFCNSKWI